MNKGLNTIEIDRYLRNDPYTRRYYGGVKALDELDIVVMKPTLFIVNHDPSNEPGSHWITLFIDSIPEHFDPLGHEPIPTLKNYLIVNGPRFIVNTKRVQGYVSNSCGLFCLFYSYFRCRNYSYLDVMNMFSDNLTVNEFVVSCFYKHTK